MIPFLISHGFVSMLHSRQSSNSVKMRRESYTKLAKKKLKELKFSPVTSSKKLANDIGKDAYLVNNDEEEKELNKIFKQLKLMTNDELEDLMSSKSDHFLQDFILNQSPVVSRRSRFKTVILVDQILNRN